MNSKLAKLIQDLRDMPPLVLQAGSSRRQYRVIARALDKRGRVICTRTNTYKTSHPVQKHFAVKVGRPDAIFLHAEISVLLSAKQDVHTLLIARIDTKGNPVPAKPCEICSIAIEQYGVKEIIHT
jgi:tRNA(Arg) A34 adenosine deaminase TadA